MDAYKENDEVAFKSYIHYKLQSLTSEEIYDLFRNSIELLKSITNLNIQCFRAGGWCIEPFSKLENVFKQFRIKYDFSVVPGTSIQVGQNYDYDFSDSPKLSFYNFLDNVNNPNPDGYFVEVPISTFQNNIIYRILNKILLKYTKDKIFGDGTGIKEKSAYTTLRQGFKYSMNILSLDKTSNIFFRYLLCSHFKKSDFIVIVSHPKTFSKQAMKNLYYLTKKYNTVGSEDLNSFFVI
jgi:hypothetical protein